MWRRERSPGCSPSRKSSRSSSTRSVRWSARATRHSGSSTPSGVIERFITSGIDRETRARIGALPRGHGFLGLIIRENRSFRIPDIAVDPRRLRLPAEPSADAQLPRRPGDREGSLGRQPVLDRQGGRRRSSRRTTSALVETFALPCRDRHRECAPPRAGRAPGDRRRARAHQPGPARRDHPEHLRRRTLAGGRSGAHRRGPRRGGATGRARDRQPPPGDPRHPQLHLRAAAGAPARDDAVRGLVAVDRGVPAQLDDRRRAAGGGHRSRSRTRSSPPISWASSTRRSSNIARHSGASRAMVVGSDGRRRDAAPDDPGQRSRVRPGDGGESRAPGSRQHALTERTPSVRPSTIASDRSGTTIEIRRPAGDTAGDRPTSMGARPHDRRTDPAR